VVYKKNLKPIKEVPGLIRFDHHMIRDRAELSVRHLLQAVVLSTSASPVALLVFTERMFRKGFSETK
jgi:hypothetical protein